MNLGHSKVESMFELMHNCIYAFSSERVEPSAEPPETVATVALHTI